MRGGGDEVGGGVLLGLRGLGRLLDFFNCCFLMRSEQRVSLAAVGAPGGVSDERLGEVGDMTNVVLR